MGLVEAAELAPDVGPVDALGSNAGSQLDPRLVVERPRLLDELLVARLAAQVLLGEGRTLVGRTRLVGHDDETAAVALRVEGPGGLGCGHAAADDGDGL